MKRSLFALAAAAALLTVGSPAFAVGNNNGPAVPTEAKGRSKGVTLRFDLLETTIPQIHAGLQSGVISVKLLSELYLKRIQAFDKAGPGINAYLNLNDRVEKEAGLLDKGLLATPKILTDKVLRRELPLYGIPVLLKDNIDTADMPTTAGSVALRGSIPPDDAFITKRLRDAGAIILGKGTLTEFANFLGLNMPTGYSSLGGFGFNPYDPRPDPRTTAPFNDGRPVLQTGGSSSGPAIGVNANLTAVAVGTETSGSLLSPASANGVVAIKPTVGLVSRDGIIPITADQDTAGPITRTVTDAAIMLGVLAGYDSKDSATAACLTAGNCFQDYTQFLDRNALQGARIAVFTPSSPLPANRQALLDNAMAVLRAQGASVRVLQVADVPTQLGTCVSARCQRFQHHQRCNVRPSCYMVSNAT